MTRTPRLLGGGAGRSHDMVVVGAGHNGLVAANHLAHEGLDVLVVEASEEISYAASAAGIMPAAEDLVFYNAVPSAADPSQAPRGQDTLYLLAVAVPFSPPEGWSALKGPASERVINQAATFYGGLPDMEIGRQVHATRTSASSCT